MILKIENLCKSFDGVDVLKNLNLDLKDVHSLGIIGPSGGGKTTLLRILAGLEKPDSGEIWVNGEKLSFDEESLAEYRKTIGMVFQSYNLFPHMSAEKNIVLPLIKVHKLQAERAKKISNKLLEKFELSEHKGKLPAQLSGGQRQRIAIVRALSINPQLLLLDEPTSALDPSLTKSVIGTLRKLRAEKKDLILVTHEMNFAKESCDYVLFISEGIVAAKGTVQEVLENESNQLLFDYMER